VDALWTISNEVLTLSGEHPTQGVDLRKSKKTKLAHFSWIRILTEALLQKEYRGISDPDQAWILGELIRYLQHPASGALEFSDMGDTWVGVRQGILAGTLSVRDKGIAPVVNNFESLMRFVAFRLSAKLGVEAKEIAPKLAKSDPGKHLQVTVGDFVSTGFPRLSHRWSLEQTSSLAKSSSRLKFLRLQRVAPQPELVGYFVNSRGLRWMFALKLRSRGVLLLQTSRYCPKLSKILLC
jgi:hypothetical protein